MVLIKRKIAKDVPFWGKIHQTHAPLKLLKLDGGERKEYVSNEMSLELWL